MSRFNTGNPIGSGSPLDLDDNAKNLDVLVNSTANTNPDRFGRQRQTYQGMENEFKSLVSNVSDASGAALTSINNNRNQVSNAATAAQLSINNSRNAVKLSADNAIAVEIPAQIARLGLEYPPIPYTAGLTLDSHTKTYSRNGSIYIWGGALGTVTSGSFNENGWQPVQGDIQLRDDVEKGTSLIRDVKHVASVTDLRLLEGRYNGQQISLTNTGLYEWDAANTAPDNGVDTIAVTGVATGRWRLNRLVRLFDELPTVAPQFNPRYERPVFCLFSSTDLSTSLMLYPCQTGTDLVLENYGRGTVSASNATNIGGAANMRVLTSRLVSRAYAANVTALSTAGTVTDSTMASGTYNGAIPAPTSFVSTSVRQNGTWSMSDRHAYNLAAGGEVEFKASRDGSVMFFRGGGSGSTVAQIYTKVSGVYTLFTTVDPSGSGGAFKVPFNTEENVKIVNAGTGQMFVGGVDFDAFVDAKSYRHYDSLRFWFSPAINGLNANWLGPGDGSNDIAWKDAETGRFFGSFHGGHSDEVFGIYADGAQIITPVSTTGFAFGSVIQGKSVSKLNSDVREYDCTSVVTYFDGGHKIDISCKTDTPVVMAEFNCGMTIASKRFDVISVPDPAVLTGLPDQTFVTLGDENSETMVSDIDKSHRIKTLFTQFDYQYSVDDGVYMLVRTADNKFYCNPLRESEMISRGVNFSIYHIFYS